MKRGFIIFGFFGLLILLQGHVNTEAMYVEYAGFECYDILGNRIYDTVKMPCGVYLIKSGGITKKVIKKTDVTPITSADLTKTNN